MSTPDNWRLWRALLVLMGVVNVAYAVLDIANGESILAILNLATAAFVAFVAVYMTRTYR